MSDNHGNTPAAWTAVTVAMLGFVVGSIFASVALKYLSRKEIRDSKLFTVPISIAAFVKL